MQPATEANTGVATNVANGRSSRMWNDAPDNSIGGCKQQAKIGDILHRKTKKKNGKGTGGVEEAQARKKMTHVKERGTKVEHGVRRMRVAKRAIIEQTRQGEGRARKGRKRKKERGKRKGLKGDIEQSEVSRGDVE